MFLLWWFISWLLLTMFIKLYFLLKSWISLRTIFLQAMVNCGANCSTCIPTQGCLIQTLIDMLQAMVLENLNHSLFPINHTHMTIKASLTQEHYTLSQCRHFQELEGVSHLIYSRPYSLFVHLTISRIHSFPKYSNSCACILTKQIIIFFPKDSNLFPYRPSFHVVDDSLSQLWLS